MYSPMTAPCHACKQRSPFAGCVLGVALVAGPARATEGTLTWAAATASPVPGGEASLEPLERAALARCGPGDSGLHGTARAIVARKLRGLAMPELEVIAHAQRAAGEPHPWPRAWAASAQVLSREPTLRRLDTWLAEHDGRLRRCGVASGVGPDGARVLAVVAIDALADLSPLPTHARTGQWLTVEARLRVQVRGGTVIVLGPSGAPRALFTSFDGSFLRARFAPDSPGEFSVQVIADTTAGPRPVLEASVFADVDPASRSGDRAAPGEDAAGDDDDGLGRMLVAARAWAGVPPLARDRGLDRMAHDHASRMAAAHELAHDVGDGDPAARLRDAGLDGAEVGENVAHASSVALAHRALWASPSHRANMLRRDFDRVGIAVARDDRGDSWVVETFTGR
jgi:hypothetical protein